MYWHSFQEFIAMGGYGFYVWSSFGITFLAMMIELWALKKRRQRIAKMSSEGTI